MPLEVKYDTALKIFVPPPLPIPLQEQEKENKEQGNSEVFIKDRCMAWRNFSAKTSKMGIVREIMNPQILEEKEGKI